MKMSRKLTRRSLLGAASAAAFVHPGRVLRAQATVTVRSALQEVDGFARRQFVVCGDEGTVDIRPLEPPHVRLVLSRKRGKYNKGYQDVPIPNLPRYDADFVDLARILHGEKTSDYPPRPRPGRPGGRPADQRPERRVTKHEPGPARISNWPW